jgi:hypothetical protein
MDAPIDIKLTESRESLIEVRRLAMTIINTINESLDRENQLRQTLLNYKTMLREINEEIEQIFKQ